MTTLPRALVVTALLSVAAGGSAQEPVEAPPPAAEDLEIYALALDSAAYPDEQVVVLLDEGVVRVGADGTYTATFRAVRQLRSPDAARALAEVSLGYDSGRETLVLDWARVVDREGTLLSGPVHAQIMDAPVSRSSPIYSDGKIVRASLGAVEEGRIVDVQYTRTFTDPAIPGDWLQRWGINGGSPVQRSRFVLDTPGGVEPRIEEQNLPEPARVTREGGRIVREWYYEELEPVESQLFAADSNSVHAGVWAAGRLEWDDVARWYADLSVDRYEVTPEVEARFAEVVDGADTREDSLRALHRWVAQEIRYVSLSLGLGGYQPRHPGTVVETGLGDCKDKATLFIALARHMGAEAHPVLVRTSGEVRGGLPSPRQFNHMVAALRWGDGWRYLDLTVPVAPFDETFGRLQGRTGVMVLPDGSSEVVEFPVDPASANRSSIVITGELSEDGTLVAEYEEVVTGAIQYRIRGEFDNRMSERRLLSLRQNLGNRVGRGGVADSVELFDGLDLETTPRLWAHVTVEDILQEVPGGWLLPLRIATYSSPAMIERLEEEGERRFPIDAGKVFGLREHYTEYRITLPEGWTADLPDDVTAPSDFGFYESVYEQEGRDLHIRRTIRGTDAVLPGEARADLIAWFRVLAADRVENVALRPHR